MSPARSQLASDTSVVLLAAGRGARMMPLTADLPKPLLQVGQHSLIEHHLIALQQCGFKHVIINLAYLGEKIREKLGDGSNYGLSIDYSDESNSGALETAGGLAKALPLIKSDHFIVINADIWTDYPFSHLLSSISEDLLEHQSENVPENLLRNIEDADLDNLVAENSNRKRLPTTSAVTRMLGRLVLVDNPAHNPDGDFSLGACGELSRTGSNKKTFSGIARYHRSMFDHLPASKAALGPLFYKLIATAELDAEYYAGIWLDVGTPERLKTLDDELSH